MTPCPQCHHWLHDIPGILHCNLSFNNIMCRFIKGKNIKGKTEKKVYRVLTDYNLSSWMTRMNPNYTKTSQQQTGTPPYMALELLKGMSPLHLYRHDIKSLFYVMLLMAAHHMIGIPKKGKRQQVVLQKSTRLLYQRWFNQQDYNTLGSLRETFFWIRRPLNCPQSSKTSFHGYRSFNITSWKGSSPSHPSYLTCQGGRVL